MKNRRSASIIRCSASIIRLFHPFFFGRFAPPKKKILKMGMGDRRKAVHDSEKPSTIAKSRPKAIRKRAKAVRQRPKAVQKRSKAVRKRPKAVRKCPKGWRKLLRMSVTTHSKNNFGFSLSCVWLFAIVRTAFPYLGRLFAIMDGVSLSSVRLFAIVDGF